MESSTGGFGEGVRWTVGVDVRAVTALDGDFNREPTLRETNAYSSIAAITTILTMKIFWRIDKRLCPIGTVGRWLAPAGR